MGYVTKYGSFWGFVPQTSGNVHWVAPAATYTLEGRAYSASDGNDGLSPERALLTLNQAITNATANVSDVIVLLPGAHSWAVTAALSKAGLTITGLPGVKGNPMRQRTSVTVSISDEIMNVTAADIEVAFLHFITITAKAAMDMTSGANRLYVHDCSFDMYTAAANTGTIGIGVTVTAQTPTDVVIDKCTFLADAAQGEAIAMGDSNRYTVSNCDIRLIDVATWAAAATAAGATSQQGVWANNRIISAVGGTITGGITGTNVGSVNAVHFLDNRFSGLFTGASAISGFSAGDARIVENYLASIGAAAGGALVIGIG